MNSLVYTMGHSTRGLEEFLDLLRSRGIRTLADVRRYPGSRRHPHFSKESLASSVEAAGMRYVHVEALGGRRRASADSPNGGWRNDSFRAYADYMSDPAFHRAVDALLGQEGPVVIVCAEAVPWRCHRNLVSDELVRRGVEVRHILGPDSESRHELNPMARERNGHLIYPPAEEPQRALPLTPEKKR